MCIPWDKDPQQQKNYLDGHLPDKQPANPKEECPYKNGKAYVPNQPPDPATVKDKILYAVQATVETRVGGIPLQGIEIKVDNASIGKTDATGKSPMSSLRANAEFNIEATYVNDAAKLKKEVFTLRVSQVNAEAGTGLPGAGKNFIAKVRDVLGTGSAGLAGDLDFTDEYPMDITWEAHPDGKNKLIKVGIQIATISLVVSYRNQNDSTESIKINAAGATHSFSGSILCMPTCSTMLLEYWNTQIDGAALTRNALMQHFWDEHDAPSTSYPCPWQIWSHVRTSAGTLLPAGLSASGSLSGATQTDNQSVPGDFADGAASAIARGEPIIVSTLATGGHIMVIRGAVVDHESKSQWLIFNDPYGNLSGADSIYGRLDISAPVGLRGTSEVETMNIAGDVEAVQSALKFFGYYTGDVNGVCDEANENDPTVKAIKKLQGSGGDGRMDPGGGTEKKANQKLANADNSSYGSKENERNEASGAGSDRGRHAYYNGTTEGTGPQNLFWMRPELRMMVVTRDTPFTKAEVATKLVPNQ